MEITPFRDEDRTSVLAMRELSLGKGIDPRPNWQPSRQIESLDIDGFRLVCREDRVVGYSAGYPIDETHLRINLLVDPSRRRRGIGSRLYAAIEEKTKLERIKHLQARVDGNDSAGIRFAETMGYREIHRMRSMVLDADDFDPGKWIAMEERLISVGYSLTTLEDELKTQNDPLSKLAKFQLAAQEGWPSPDPTQKGNTSVEETIRTFDSLREPGLLVILKHKNEYVGYTSTRRGPGTAVHPGYRNRGLAKVMKARAISSAIAAGQTHFDTCSSNPAMQRVNEQLGFRFDGRSEVRFVKGL